MDLERELKQRRQRVDAALQELLPAERGPAATVARAMRYAVFGGGKRLRPILSLAACESCGGSADEALEPAAALELLHTYSLIHDDLPAMDDDDLRRGRPTVHRAFDEAVAILAGDALLTLAFGILGTRPAGAERAARRAEAVAVAAAGAGVAGMVGGQIADLEAEGRPADPQRLEWIHRHKTGSLLAASAEVGAIHAGAPVETRRALAAYGAALGLAFQITDDVLDRTASAERLGKTPGKDEAAGKATYPALYGVEDSRRRALALVDDARAELRRVELEAPLLDALARYAVDRTS